MEPGHAGTVDTYPLYPSQELYLVSYTETMKIQSRLMLATNDIKDNGRKE